MSEFETMPIDLLRKQVDQARLDLESADAGTGMTHLNDARILAEKASIARRLNAMAFYLAQRDGLTSEELAIIAAECSPYFVRKSTLLESVYTA